MLIAFPGAHCLAWYSSPRWCVSPCLVFIASLVFIALLCARRPSRGSSPRSVPIASHGARCIAGARRIALCVASLGSLPRFSRGVHRLAWCSSHCFVLVASLGSLPRLVVFASLDALRLAWCLLPRLMLFASLGAYCLAWCSSSRLMCITSLGDRCLAWRARIVSRLVLVASLGAHRIA